MPPNHSVDEERDKRLAEIVSEAMDALSRGQETDLSELCTAHPDLADDLRELWGAIMVTHVAGTEAVGNVSVPASPAMTQPLFQTPFEMDDFVLEQELGRGGMGVVYRARRISSGEPLAIKMMLKGEMASSVERQRFEAEAVATGRLRHPHIVPIYGFGEHAGRAYLCMKLVVGETLSDVLSRGPLPAERTARIMAKVARAIDFAHHQGVLHRDLKPSNILLDEDDWPYVCDFGLAKQALTGISLTKSGAVIGTPAYMAPEQAAGARGQMGPTSDVYSLGAILYHCLTGQAPFQADSPVDVLLMVLEQEPALPRAVNPNCDRVLEMISLRSLQKPQDLRYASAGALADDLEAFLKQEPVSAASGRLAQVLAGLFRETHHAQVLENWGLLWMWHSLVVLLASVVTNAMFWLGVERRVYYELMWGIGFSAWAAVFWLMRRKQGPVTFVERQIAHVWAASMVGVVMLFPFEGYLGLGLLRLAPAISIVAAMVFLIKAGILSGTFYIQAGILLVTAGVMALFPNCAMVIFGVVCAGCFFFPGLKYNRQRHRATNGL